MTCPQIETCAHESSDENGFCNTCGLRLSRVSYKSEWNSSYVHIKAEKSITGELVTKNFPCEVKVKANGIFINLKTGTHRGRKRKQLIFFCVYHAYKELNLHCDPNLIAKEIGIRQGDMSRAFSTFSPVQTGYQLLNRQSTCIDFLPDYCELVGLSREMVPLVTQLADELICKDPLLKERFPQTVAAGILRYFTMINGMVIDSGSFASSMHLSEATINAMLRQIQQVDNK